MTLRTYVAALLLAVWAGGGALPTAAHAQETEAQADTTESAQDDPYVGVDTSSVPNFEPYRSDMSLGQHILSLPSTAFHYLITRPLGSLTVWAEEHGYIGRNESLFWVADHTVGIFPAFRTGGSYGWAVGASVVHQRLFGEDKEGELRFLYGNTSNFTTELSLRNSNLFGTATFFDADLSYLADSDEPLYLDSDRPRATRTSYGVRRVDGRAEVGLEPRRGPGWSGLVEYDYIDAGVGTGRGADRLPETLAGLGKTHLLSGGASALLDYSEGNRPRDVSGGRLYLLYNFTGSLDESMRYHRLRGEWQQYIPLPFPYPYRRLAFRTRLEKLLPVADKEIPFYELSTLGSARALRGFNRNQFRGEGSLLFTLEYRYPIWDTWDALLFVDTGQAFDDFNDVAVSDFNWAYGLGFRFYTSSGLSLRLDLGYTRQGLRVFSSGGPNFTVTTRGQQLR